MPQTPQRPFVPQHTPASPISGSTAAFRLARPFVHGISEQWVDEPQAMIEGSTPVEATHNSFDSPVEKMLPPIGDFLDTSGELFDTGVAAESLDESLARDFDYAAGMLEPDGLPPVEHFLDPLPDIEGFAPLPGIGGFAPDVVGALIDEGSSTDAYALSTMSISEPYESGWVDTDWQQYDWHAAATLGEVVDIAASDAWSETDWDAASPPARDFRETAAEAIASALDNIAQRIRNGELTVPQPGLADPAAIAATLATLLGVRR